MSRLLLSLLTSLLFVAQTTAAEPRNPERMEWTIDGVKREADVFLVKSEKNEPAPLVFGFHGHGGSMRNAARSFRLHDVWPEAFVVYMQGLNTPGKLTDPEGKKSKRLNECGDGTEWGKNCTLYPSKTGNPVVTLIHPGAHGYPEEAPELIVKFFKEHCNER